MHLENLVFDAVEPQLLGCFWEAALGCERLTDEPGIFETRLAIEGGPTFDLCFQPVAAPPAEPVRLHLDLSPAPAEGFGGQVDRNLPREQWLLDLGARHVDIGQRDVPWVVLADPEGNPFCLMASSPVADTGPISALPLHSADPERDVRFWAWLTGWVDTGSQSLRHPSLRGPLLQCIPEPAAKPVAEPVAKPAAKNRLHLDLRLEARDSADAVAAGIIERGGHELHPGWGDVPWRIFADPSGNEFCVLPAHS